MEYNFDVKIATYTYITVAAPNKDVARDLALEKLHSGDDCEEVQGDFYNNADAVEIALVISTATRML